MAAQLTSRRARVNPDEAGSRRKGEPALQPLTPRPIAHDAGGARRESGNVVLVGVAVLRIHARVKTSLPVTEARIASIASEASRRAIDTVTSVVEPPSTWEAMDAFANFFDCVRSAFSVRLDYQSEMEAQFARH